MGKRPVDLKAVLGRLMPALALLRTGSEYAEERGCGLWEFAVDIDDLLRYGASKNDLRWLIACGYVEHGDEITRATDKRRSFRCPGRFVLNASTCFVLSAAGQHWLETAAAEPLRQAAACSPLSAHRDLLGLLSEPGMTRPHWDPSRRELRLGERLVKRFRSLAPNQERVLTAFEEEGWPTRIDDPLPPHPDQDAKRRLRDTIGTLNRGQKLIRFSADGRGQGICWESIQETV